MASCIAVVSDLGVVQTGRFVADPLAKQSSNASVKNGVPGELQACAAFAYRAQAQLLSRCWFMRRQANEIAIYTSWVPAHMIVVWLTSEPMADRTSMECRPRIGDRLGAFSYVLCLFTGVAAKKLRKR